MGKHLMVFFFRDGILTTMYDIVFFFNEGEHYECHVMTRKKLGMSESESLFSFLTQCRS